jgi:hypothetical protein
MPKHVTPPEIRAWRHVDIRDINDCWPFIGQRDMEGYGRVRVGSRKTVRGTEKAHRLVYCSVHGTISGTSEVCHTCDNPPCCNPRHLFEGTRRQNFDDMIRKRRHAHGERDGNAKLTAAAVLAIRRRYAQGGIYHRELAAEYGVSPSNIGAILTRQTWAHLE